ncbi:MAG: flagellar motor switch protein FliM [Planctomycetota bacterium]
MPDMLDQSEIDALLSSVATEDTGDAGEEDGGVQVFSRRRGGKPFDLEIRDYDFKRPERVSKDQMRALETLHEAFARSFGAALSGFLRTIIETKVAHIEQMTFAEFTHSLPNPTCFNLISCDPLDGEICLEISPLIVYPIIDRLLGGSNADLFIPQRPLTSIELRLVDQLLNRATASYAEAWAGIKQIDFQVTEHESNPALVQIVAPNEVVVVVGFEIKMGGRAGTMALAIPYAVIEPVIDKLSNQTWAAYKRNRKDPTLRDRVAGHLDTASVSVAATLADTTMTVSDLRNLAVADLILTEKPASSPLSLLVEGKRKYIGHLGQFRGNRAFKVKRAFHAKDRV